LYQLNRLRGFYSFFGPVRFVSAQLASSPPPFPLSNAASPPVDVVTLSHHVTLHFHWVKTSLLPPLHLSATLYPLRIARLTLSTVIKKIISTLATIPITKSRLYFTSSLARDHAIGAPPTVIIPFQPCLTLIVPPHIDTHGDELADHISLPE
jgi:hypothetical protein